MLREGTKLCERMIRARRMLHEGMMPRKGMMLCEGMMTCEGMMLCEAVRGDDLRVKIFYCILTSMFVNCSCIPEHLIIPLGS